MKSPNKLIPVLALLSALSGGCSALDEQREDETSAVQKSPDEETPERPKEASEIEDERFLAQERIRIALVRIFTEKKEIKKIEMAGLVTDKIKAKCITPDWEDLYRITEKAGGVMEETIVRAPEEMGKCQKMKDLAATTICQAKLIVKSAPISLPAMIRIFEEQARINMSLLQCLRANTQKPQQKQEGKLHPRAKSITSSYPTPFLRRIDTYRQ